MCHVFVNQLTTTYIALGRSQLYKHEVYKLLVHTLVMVRLDYCNTLLCGARKDVIRQLEQLQRQAARVVCKKYKNDLTSVTELMWGLHWLPIRARIQYKILLLVYKAFTNGSPT